MFKALIRKIWGDFQPGEIRRFCLLGLIFFFVIGSYWLMHTIKDPIFRAMIGFDYQPTANIISVFWILISVLLYSKLINMVKQKHTLFFLIGGAYLLFFFGAANLIGHPTIGLSNTMQSKWRLFGWIMYFVVESYGAVMVALFWSFVASISETNSAKRGYPIIVVIGQIGSILGPFFALQAKKIGMQNLSYLLVAFLICLLCSVYLFTFLTPTDSFPKNANQPQTGFMEGLRLLITQSYLFGIFIIVTCWEIIQAIIEFQLKKQADLLPAYASVESFAQFMGLFGLCINTTSILIALFGTSYLLRKIGLRGCLLLFPGFLTIYLALFYTFFKTGLLSLYPLFWSFFVIVVIAKAVSYSFNNPAKEMLYLPTSEDAKFKAKGWIDIFGLRMAKGCGAQINNTLLSAKNGSIFFLLDAGLLIVLTLGIAWIFCASYLGTIFTKRTREKELV